MTRLRSMLFTPGDSEKKLARAYASSADALIIDLEDGVAIPNKVLARDMTREFLSSFPPANRRKALYVRIGDVNSAEVLLDLCAAISGRPDGIVLPKCADASEISVVSSYLSALEVSHGAPRGSTQILAIAAETAAGVLSLHSYAARRGDLGRLVGLSWGPWDLAAEIGAVSNRDSSGEFSFTYRMAKSMTLLAAKGAGLLAIDTPHTDYKDEAGLIAQCQTARREGWTGKMAIHPDQIGPINSAFTPSSKDLEHARNIVAAFGGVEGGVAMLDGVMLDLPHLRQARQLLASAMSTCTLPE